MRVLVVYESEFGATRAVAERIGRGLGAVAEVSVVDSRRWRDADAWTTDLDLLVLGAPTHARRMPTPLSRQQVSERVLRPGNRLRLEPFSCAEGLREWIASHDLRGLQVAVFTTRVDMPRLLSGSAGRCIARAARRSGAVPMDAARDFLVRKDGALVDDALASAEQWGVSLAVSALRYDDACVTSG
jgi:hypothetical protein